jgi:predicted metalloendopeptidase
MGLLLVALLLALTSASATLAQSPVASPVGSATAATHGVQIADMDLSVSPGDDFFRYANGAWIDRTEIPAAYPLYAPYIQLTELTDQQQLNQLNELIQHNTLPVGSDQWKAVTLYQQGIDQVTRNAKGITPVKPQLDAIATVTDLDSLHALMTSPDRAGVPDFFNAFAFADLEDSSLTTAWLNGPILGLPDTTLYTEDTADNIAARDAYKTAAAQFFQLIGMTEPDATAAAQAVYDFEADLAANMLTPLEWQDADNYYNPISLDDLQTLYPALDWQAYMTFLGATVNGSSVVVNPQERLLQNMAAILSSTDIETIKDYLTLQVMLSAAPYLDETSQSISFGLKQALDGTAEQLPIENDVLKSVNGLMPDALGQLYVSEYFSPEAKADIEALVDQLIAAFRVRLQNNTWMSADTKAAAIAKLDAMGVKVGYPDTWRTYEDYSIGNSYWDSVVDSVIADSQSKMAKYGQPVDRDLWGMGAQVVNAGYEPLNNDITFPAAFLQPPYYDPDADLATNYGAIGASIGHEITHGFDLSGSQFDADGNLVDWWTAEDRANFQALNDKVAAQYSTIEVLPDLYVDGQRTVTENVADMGGLQMAWDALQSALQQEDDPGLIDGYTQAQRFFLAYAQSWRAIYLEEFLRTMVQTNEHAPDFVRGVVPAQNMDEFYAAFPEIQAGDAEYLAPADRVVIW